MLVGAAQQALKPDSALTAAAIAYFAIFSLFPLALLSIGVASFSLGPLMDQHLVVQRLEFVAPALGQLLGKNLDEIIRARGAVTVVAFGSLIWSASSMFFVLTGTLTKVWGLNEVVRSGSGAAWRSYSSWLSLARSSSWPRLPIA